MAKKMAEYGRSVNPWELAEVASASRKGLALTVVRSVNEVAEERQRQVTAEGWTAEHDDQHRAGEIACAAACYALSASPIYDHMSFDGLWPWEPHWFKPNNRRRDLVRAGALILAEIERLDRMDSK